MMGTFLGLPYSNVDHDQCQLEPINPGKDIIERWCAVVYDGVPYSGIITDYYDKSVDEVNEPRCTQWILLAHAT